MTPESRKEQLLTQRVGDELVIYDERTHEAHRLNRTAAAVWEQADGVRTVPELASSLRQ
jgi:Coenzyme PQQ synthesis protein D (PqqD)